MEVFEAMGLFITSIVVIVSWVYTYVKKNHALIKQILPGKNVPKRANKVLTVQRE